MRVRGFLTADTIHVRLAAVDAPEVRNTATPVFWPLSLVASHASFIFFFLLLLTQAAHFGKPAQPFSNEAKVFLQRLLVGQRVTVHLHRRDQYGRAVATLWLHRFGVPWTNVSLELVRAGLATLYVGSDAVPVPYLDALRRAEDRARGQRLNMWSTANYESPMAFKKRLKAGTAPDASPAAPPPAKRSLGRRLLGGLRDFFSPSQTRG